MDHDQLTRIEAMLRSLVDQQNPVIKTGEIMRLLNYKSKSAALRWISHFKLRKVGPGYRRNDFLAAMTRPR